MLNMSLSFISRRRIADGPLADSQSDKNTRRPANTSRTREKDHAEKVGRAFSAATPALQ
jgi:hypothetical protein